MIKRFPSVLRILVANIADEDFLLAIPTLEVASGQLQQVLCWWVGEHGDVFFGYVADGFVVRAADVEH